MKLAKALRMRWRGSLPGVTNANRIGATDTTMNGPLAQVCRAHMPRKRFPARAAGA